MYFMNKHSNKVKFTSKPKSKNYQVGFFSPTMYLQGIPCFAAGKLRVFGHFSHEILELPAQPLSHAGNILVYGSAHLPTISATEMQ